MPESAPPAAEAALEKRCRWAEVWWPGVRAAIVWEEAGGVEEGWGECWGGEQVCYQGVGLEGYEG